MACSGTVSKDLFIGHLSESDEANPGVVLNERIHIELESRVVDTTEEIIKQMRGIGEKLSELSALRRRAKLSSKRADAVARELGDLTKVLCCDVIDVL